MISNNADNYALYMPFCILMLTNKLLSFFSSNHFNQYWLKSMYLHQNNPKQEIALHLFCANPARYGGIADPGKPGTTT